MSQLPEGSRTAKIAAAYRARASERPNPICVDEWAQHLADEEGRALLPLGDARAPGMELGVALRTAWLDEAVRAFDGDQIVLLGAGLDTRAARLARAGVTFFEVDHPSTQARKRLSIEAISSYPKDAATMIACDLEHDDFTAPLIDGGFRRDVPTLVIWEGVTAYLTELAVRMTIHRLASMMSEGSGLYFDHLGPARNDTVSRAVEEVGEPFLFLSNDVRSLVREEGLARVSSRSMADLCREKQPDAAGADLYDRWFLVDASR